MATAGLDLLAMDPKKELKNLIQIVIREDGSDLHIGAGRHPAIRVAGELIFLQKKEIPSNEEVLAMLVEMAGQAKLDHFLSVQEVDFSYDFQGQFRFRGNAFRG